MAAAKKPVARKTPDRVDLAQKRMRDRAMGLTNDKNLGKLGLSHAREQDELGTAALNYGTFRGANQKAGDAAYDRSNKIRAGREAELAKRAAAAKKAKK